MEIRCPKCDYVARGDTETEAEAVLRKHSEIQHDLGTGFERPDGGTMMAKIVEMIRR